MTNDEFRDHAKSIGCDNYEELAALIPLVPKTTVHGWWYRNVPVTAVQIITLLEEIARRSSIS